MPPAGLVHVTQILTAEEERRALAAAIQAKLERGGPLKRREQQAAA